MKKVIQFNLSMKARVAMTWGIVTAHIVVQEFALTWPLLNWRYRQTRSIDDAV